MPVPDEPSCKKLDEVAQKLLGRSYAELDERATDAVARFGRSWTFIGLFAAAMVGWGILNPVILARYGTPFDLYPYIRPNLFLSRLASIQGPIISMSMSQNRRLEKDRIDVEQDREVNLKAEPEILLLHEKGDCCGKSSGGELLAIQKQQMELLSTLRAAKPGMNP